MFSFHLLESLFTIWQQVRELKSDMQCLQCNIGQNSFANTNEDEKQLTTLNLTESVIYGLIAE